MRYTFIKDTLFLIEFILKFDNNFVRKEFYLFLSL